MAFSLDDSGPYVFRYVAPGGVRVARVFVGPRFVEGCFMHLKLPNPVIASFRLDVDEANAVQAESGGAMLSFGLRRFHSRGTAEWLDLAASAAIARRTVPDHIASDLRDNFPIRILTPRGKLDSMSGCWIMVFTDERCSDFKANVPVKKVEGPLMSARLLAMLAASNGMPLTVTAH